MLDYITFFSRSNNFFLNQRCFIMRKILYPSGIFRPCFQRFASGQDDKVNERNQIMRSSSFLVLPLVDVGVAQRQKKLYLSKFSELKSFCGPYSKFDIPCRFLKITYFIWQSFQIIQWGLGIKLAENTHSVVLENILWLKCLK